MRCNNCGNEVKENEAICTKCGARLDQADKPANKANERAAKGENKVLSIISKLIAAAATAALIASLFKPFLITERGSLTANVLFADYPVIILIFILFAALFLIFQLIDRKGLSVIGLVGTWIWVLIACYIISVSVSRAVSIYNTAYTFGQGFYLCICGLAGQIVAMILK